MEAETNIEAYLSEEEKAAKSYFEWGDENLGRLTRLMANQLKGICKENQEMYFSTCAEILAGLALQTNSGQLKLTLQGFSYKGERKGDWEIIVRDKLTPYSSYTDVCGTRIESFGKPEIMTTWGCF